MQLFRVMEQGNLVPDEEVVGLIKDAMAATSQDSEGYVLDGFPATMEQAKLFESKIGSPTKIIVVAVNADRKPDAIFEDVVKAIDG